MKICFPIVPDQGLDSLIAEHSAPTLLVIDTKSGEAMSTLNSNPQHAPGCCNPLKGLADTIDAVAVKGIGGGALNGLTRAGLKVYWANGETVAENIACLTEESLPELSADQTCGGHGHLHGCSHR